MLISQVPVYQIKVGMKLRDPETGQIGEITYVEHEFGDTYSWVKWLNTDHRSGFWGNHEDFEVIE